MAINSFLHRVMNTHLCLLYSVLPVIGFVITLPHTALQCKKVSGSATIPQSQLCEMANSSRELTTYKQIYQTDLVKSKTI